MELSVFSLQVVVAVLLLMAQQELVEEVSGLVLPLVAF
jgi:hypothetical protein